MSLKNKYNECEIEKWNELIETFKDNHMSYDKEWIFRGQKEDWLLKTSLERALEDFDLKLEDPIKIEESLIREFKRKCHLHKDDVPEKDDTLEWIALMQHHGAPTRLLDWTYSFFVAVFFAVEGEKGKYNNDNYPVVYALNSCSKKDDWIGKKVKNILKKNDDAIRALENDRDLHKSKNFEKVFLQKNNKDFVYPINPSRLNERLVIHQGVFLCPGNIEESFEKNMKAVLSNRDKKSLSNINLNLTLKKEKKYCWDCTA